jgi:hypothetical protein
MVIGILPLLGMPVKVFVKSPFPFVLLYTLGQSAYQLLYLQLFTVAFHKYLVVEEKSASFDLLPE